MSLVMEKHIKELKAFAETYPCGCSQRYRGTTNYHGLDCETAVVQEFVEQYKDKFYAR